jgi:murein DD-endopeptidase MepM/ murein hydrolase activator NlpD
MGCVSLKTQDEIAVAKPSRPVRQGTYHKVKQGETLWRIAKTYNVSVDDIAQTNNIPRAAKIEKGQLVFIPGATKVLDIVLDVDYAQNDFVWPVKGKVIRYYHERYGNEVHKGIDIKASVGDEVKAARTGRVVFADYLSGYGYTVILDHSDGFHSVYANNSKLLVALGELVLKNGTLAHVGHSRNLAYLHFQIRKKSVEDNPLYYLP